MPGLSPDTTAAPPTYELLHTKLQQHTDGLLVAEEHQRAAKHVQDQLDFMRKEQALLRRDLVAARTHVRESEEVHRSAYSLLSSGIEVRVVC